MQNKIADKIVFLSAYGYHLKLFSFIISDSKNNAKCLRRTHINMGTLFHMQIVVIYFKL